MKELLFKRNRQLMKYLLSAAMVFGFSITETSAQVNQPMHNCWTTDDNVKAVVSDTANHLVYIGGNFTKLLLPVEGGILVDSSAGTINTQLPVFNALTPNESPQVSVAIPDGSGGWILGGNFAMIGGQTRNNLAQIDANGNLTSWNPNLVPVTGTGNSPVFALKLSGNTLYVGGLFTGIGGQSRNNLAAVNMQTGAVTPWNPNVAGGRVKCLDVDNNTVYIGGDFTSVGGQSRNALAAIDATTGLATSWNPNPSGGNGQIYAISAQSSDVYVGGNFSSISGVTRNNLAALKKATNAATAWIPNPDGPVNAILITANSIFIGGEFATISGASRNRIASYDPSTLALSFWSPPSFSGIVSRIAVLGNKVFAAGTFGSISGQSRSGLAAFTLSTASLTSWNPNLDGGAYSLAASGNSVFLGVGFQAISRPQKGLACINTLTGQPTSWNPNPDDGVYSMALKNGIVYVGGFFSSVGGQFRNHLAAIDANTGLATGWDPDANGLIEKMTILGNKLYAGGYFTSIGGQSRNRLASVDLSTGITDSWNPNPNGFIYALAAGNGNIYIGGDFTSIGGQSRNKIAAIDATTGLASSWNPNANGNVLSFALNGSNVYVGGGFTTIGGKNRNYVAVLDATTGLAKSWNPNANGGPASIAINGNRIYLAGYFSTIGGQTQNGVAAFTLPNAVPTSWNPNPNGYATCIALDIDKVIIAGSFTNFGGYGNGSLRRYFAIFEDCTGAPAVPGSITQTGGAIKVCPGETRTYTIAGVAHATGYTWTVPSGAAIQSGQGTTSIVVSFNGSYPTSDTIKVRAENGCGNSAYKAKVVTKGPNPAKPSVITGDYYGVCGASGKPYSIIDVPGLTYAWSFSNGNASVASGQGTASITANFAPAYMTGALNVTGTNGCGTSPVRSRTIKAIPATPESITGDAVVCAHETGVPYSTPAISGAATYTWKAPTGAHISDGVTTSPLNTLTTTANAVTVNFGTASGDVRVKATNACGYTGNFIFPVTVGCGGGRLAGNAVSESTADVVIYPNPASDVVNISFQSKEGTSYSISLYDVLGKEVLVEEGSAIEGTNLTELNTASLASGVYHLVLKGEGIDYNTKLVLDK